MSNAIVQKPVSTGLVDPKTRVNLSQVAADACRALLDSCIVTIPNRKGGPPSKHLRIEGWSMLAQAHGLTVGADEPLRLEDKQGKLLGYKARGWVRDHNGNEVGAAWGMVTLTETRWSQAPEFQVASMAQTRGVAKAARLALGHAVALLRIEHLEATPAEEVDHDTPPPKPAPVQAPAQVKPKPAPQPKPEPAQVVRSNPDLDKAMAADPFPGDEHPMDEKVTKNQWSEICRLAKLAKIGADQILKPLGLERGSDLSWAQANMILLDLQAKAGE